MGKGGGAGKRAWRWGGISEEEIRGERGKGSEEEGWEGGDRQKWEVSGE